MMTAPASDQSDRAPHLQQTIALTALAQAIDSLLDQFESPRFSARADSPDSPSSLSGSSIPSSSAFLA